MRLDPLRYDIKGLLLEDDRKYATTKSPSYKTPGQGKTQGLTCTTGGKFPAYTELGKGACKSCEIYGAIADALRKASGMQPGPKMSKLITARCCTTSLEDDGVDDNNARHVDGE